MDLIPKNIDLLGTVKKSHIQLVISSQYFIIVELKSN